MRPTATRLITVTAGLLFAALGAGAQAEQVFRIGVLWPAPAEEAAPYIAAFREELAEFGYVLGQNVSLEIRYGDGRPERFPGLAAELVRLKVDVILAASNGAITAVQKATPSIPIVMVVATDPVATGFVASLARPGGNITGLSGQAPDFAGKGLQLLKEVVPHLSRVAILWDSGFPGAQHWLSELEAGARALKVQRQLVELHSASELDGAFAAAAGNRAEAAYILGSPMLLINRVRIGELAVKHRLPSLCGALREWAQAGCLISLGPSLTDQLRRAVYFVDRIRKGAKPSDLPVEQPTKLSLVINLRTAKVLGLGIPRPLLQRADEVIGR